MNSNETSSPEFSIVLDTPEGVVVFAVVVVVAVESGYACSAAM